VSKPTTITTECGHQWQGNADHHEIRTLRNCTTDCTVCGRLLLIKGDQWGDADPYQVPHRMHCVDFHKEMHRQDPNWPADGSGTGYVEFGEGR